MEKYLAIKKKERDFLLECSELKGLNHNEINLLHRDIKQINKQIVIEQNLLDALKVVDSWFNKT